MLNIKEGTWVFYIKNLGVDKLTNTTDVSVETGILGSSCGYLNNEECHNVDDDVISDTCIFKTYDEAVEKVNAVIEAEINEC